MRNFIQINPFKEFRLFRNFVACVLLTLFIVGLYSCDQWKDDLQLDEQSVDKSLYELVRVNPDLSSFASLLKLTGYDQMLNGQQTITVFAPNNDALQDMDLNDIDYLKQWIQNYMAYLSYYTNSSGNFVAGGYNMSAIEMINGKNITVGSSDIEQTNIVGSNGVLHIINKLIPFRNTVLEYLMAQNGYKQIDYIKSQQDSVMDVVRSVQTGVNTNGQPIYDTVWVSQNSFLEAFPLDDEGKKFTVILLDNSSFDAIRTKYSKYMYQKDTKAMDKEILRQLTSDLVLKYVEINQSGRYPSYGDVLVDIDNQNIIESYQASNGMVYKLSAANIKMYENKIKTKIIEGEDYVSRFDSQNAWTVRYRSWASGGKDVMLKGQTKQTYNWTINTTPTPKDTSATANFIYTGDVYVQSKTTNAYIEYAPTMYSCPYEIYWMSYDDVAGHRYTLPKTSPAQTMPMILEQKLLISFPGEPKLYRDGDGRFQNHISNATCLAAYSTAGVQEEKRLLFYRLNADNLTVGSANEKLFLLDNESDGVYPFGSGGTLICPTYGEATFCVANTVRRTVADAGMIFLDYIRLVPAVDIND